MVDPVLRGESDFDGYRYSPHPVKPLRRGPGLAERSEMPHRRHQSQVGRGIALHPLVKPTTQRDNSSCYSFIFPRMQTDERRKKRIGAAAPRATAGGWPLFSFGRVIVTAKCFYTLQQYNLSALEVFGRHTVGDWGDTAPKDKAWNDQVLLSGQGPLLSLYRLAAQDHAVTIAILTARDRLRTTIFLADEYAHVTRG